MALVFRRLRDGEQVAADLADVLGALKEEVDEDDENGEDDEEDEKEEQDKYDDYGDDYDDDFTDIAFIFDAVLPEVPHRELLSNHLEENKHMREFFYFFVKITKNLFL